MKLIRRILPDLLVVLAFVAVSVAYFSPAVFDGRVLTGHDSTAGIGIGQEAKEFYEQTGERTRWTDSAFSGMPTYQISPSYDSTDVLARIAKFYHLYLPSCVWYLFVMLLGFYILMRAFDFRVWMAALGAVAWAFSSYFLIIIGAGHIWKLVTLAYIPPTIAGMVLIYRGRMFWGAVMMALFTALQISSNHVQMTYYFLFVMFFLFLAFAYKAWREGGMRKFAYATVVCFISGVIGVGINASNLYHTYEYSKESMRGPSELTLEKSDNDTSSGLKRDYITQWSYGVGETWSLLVPNVKGGASTIQLGRNEKALEKASPEYRRIVAQMGQYWGEQPFTAGPVYVGAFVMFLFVLGLFVVKGPVKWALVAATVLSVLLSWGKNFMPLTDFFIDYMPMYDKFRAVSSILVIAEFTIPLLAVMALRELYVRRSDGDLSLREIGRPVFVAYLLTGGVAFLFWLFPDVFFSSFVSQSDLYMLQNIPEEHMAPLLANLTLVRETVFAQDALTSFGFISLGVGVMSLWLYGKLKTEFFAPFVILLFLVDLWHVDKRYLNDDMFVPRRANTEIYKLTEADRIILEDKSDFRVLNLSTNTFNENNTSYYHKSIGGYHAAKLRRYQELIERYISPQMQNVFKAVADTKGILAETDGRDFDVLNMLNTKYVIMPVGGGMTYPVANPHAFGSGWFVDDVMLVGNADEELGALKDVDLRRTAVVDRRFEHLVDSEQKVDSAATVHLSSYSPDHLSYYINSSQGGNVVLSEIYYPGWTATLDGHPLEIGRADYVLRFVKVPAGAHKLIFEFKPRSIRVTESVAFICLALLGGGVVLVALKRRRWLKRY